MGPVLGVVGGAGDLAAGAGPVGVDEFASWLVDALVGVCAEVVALGLEQVGGETLGTVAVKEGQGRGECGGGDAECDGVGEGLAPRILIGVDGGGEEAVEEEIG